MTIDVVRASGTVTDRVHVRVVLQEVFVVTHTTIVNYLSNLISVKTENSNIQVKISPIYSLIHITYDQFEFSRQVVGDANKTVIPTIDGNRTLPIFKLVTFVNGQSKRVPKTGFILEG